MTYRERKSLALIFNLLIKKLGMNMYSGQKIDGNYTVKPYIPSVGENVNFKVKELSWLSIYIYNETNRHTIWNTGVMQARDIVIRTEERYSTDIRITNISESRVEGEVDGYRFLIEFPSYDRVEITDHERGRKFTYEVRD